MAQYSGRHAGVAAIPTIGLLFVQKLQINLI
jgi:hypothetical protein